MKVIAIDPGYERLGIAVIEKEQNAKGLPGSGREKLLYSHCFQTSKNLTHPERLLLVAQEIERVIVEFMPEALSIETLFFAKNAKTALKVAEVRGVILTEAIRRGLRICELSPGEIKIAVAGTASADKKAVIKMVGMILSIKDTKKMDDEYDAIASGLAFFALLKSKSLK